MQVTGTINVSHNDGVTSQAQQLPWRVQLNQLLAKVLYNTTKDEKIGVIGVQSLTSSLAFI